MVEAKHIPTSESENTVFLKDPARRLSTYLIRLSLELDRTGHPAADALNSFAFAFFARATDIIAEPDIHVDLPFPSLNKELNEEVIKTLCGKKPEGNIPTGTFLKIVGVPGLYFTTTPRGTGTIHQVVSQSVKNSLSRKT